MDCDRVRDALRGPAHRERPVEGALAPELAAHLAACPLCTALAGGVADALARVEAVADLDLSRLQAAALRDVADERGPAAWLRGRSTPVRAAAVAAAALAVVLGVLAVNRRPDLGLVPALRIASDALTLVLATIVLAALVVRPAQRPSPRPVVVGLALALGVLAVGLAGLLPPVHAADSHADFGTRALACFGYACACAMPALVVATWASRTGEQPWRPRARSAVLAGCVGALGVWLHCPIVDPAHLLVGHATVLVPLVVLAALAARSLPLRAPA